MANRVLTNCSQPGDALYRVMTQHVHAAMFSLSVPFPVSQLRARIDRMGELFVKVMNVNRIVHLPVYRKIVNDFLINGVE